MAEIGLIGSLISGVTGFIGAQQQAKAQKAAGKAQQQQFEYEAKQLDIRAKEEQAVGQQEGREIERRKMLALSANEARGAAGGFTTTDPTAVDISGEIEEYGDLQKQLAAYGGKSRRTGYEAEATGRRLSGQAARTAGKTAAKASTIGGFGGFFSSIGSAFQNSSVGNSSSLRYG